MKKLTNSRALLILLVLTVSFVLPMKAQKNDGFFRNDMLYENRADGYSIYNLTNQHFGDSEIGSFNLFNQTFGSTTPLGDGMLIMLGAGACYAVRKRKRTK